jgi:hypothetical protein
MQQQKDATTLFLIIPDRNNFVPSGYCVVRRFKMAKTEKLSGSAC